MREVKEISQLTGTEERIKQRLGKKQEYEMWGES
jgi:hypothetical protein